MNPCTTSRKKGLGALAAAVLLAAGIVATTAGAQSGGAVAGTYGFGKATPKNACKPASATLVLCTLGNAQLVYHGSLEGSSIINSRWTMNCKKGIAYGTGVETFKGSVKGVGSGTLTWWFSFTSGWSCAKSEFIHLSATDTIASSTGALAGLSGSIHRGDTTYRGAFR